VAEHRVASDPRREALRHLLTRLRVAANRYEFSGHEPRSRGSWSAEMSRLGIGFTFGRSTHVKEPQHQQYPRRPNGRQESEVAYRVGDEWKRLWAIWVGDALHVRVIDYATTIETRIDSHEFDRVVTQNHDDSEYRDQNCSRLSRNFLPYASGWPNSDYVYHRIARMDAICAVSQVLPLNRRSCFPY